MGNTQTTPQPGAPEPALEGRGDSPRCRWQRGFLVPCRVEGLV